MSCADEVFGKGTASQRMPRIRKLNLGRKPVEAP
jgi:hypothetical protein